MEDPKRESSNKAKRSRNDQVKQVVLAYLQRRNYPVFSTHKLSPKEFEVASLIENEISRPNSILYSCFNNDPIVIEHMFSKLVNWLKEMLKVGSTCEDLEVLVGPLFCHFYLEILRGGHSERASTFFKTHLPSVDRNKCDNFIKELINAFGNESSLELPNLRDNFRRNKYVIELSKDSVSLLKRFLIESGHIVLLQVLQNWFSIVERETIVQERPEIQITEWERFEVPENDASNMVETRILCNGHSENGTKRENKLSVQKLLDVIEAVEKEQASVYSVNVSNVKDEVTCGILSRPLGLCAYSYNNTIVLRSLRTLEQLRNTLTYGEVVLLGHSARVYGLAFFQQYNHLVSASQDKTVRLFDLEDYKEKITYTGHTYPVYCLSTSQNKDYFVSGSYDRSIRLWSTSRRDSLRLFVGHTQEVTSVDFHPNSNYIVSGSADRTIRMWSISNAEPVRSLLGSKGTVYSICFSNDGHYLVSAGEDRRLRVWDLTAAKQLVEIKTGSQPITKIAINEDQSVIVTGCVDGTLKTWDFSALLKNGTETVSNEPIYNVSLNPKLLDLEFCYGTFGCFTAQHGTSIVL